jgi:hypothetical protein
MKNFKVLAVLSMVLGVGCYGFNKPSADARSAAANMAVASDAVPDKPYFNPTEGIYEVRLDPATSDGEADAYADPLDPLSNTGFEVWSYANGVYEMYIRPGYIFNVVNGEFSYVFNREYDGTFETSIGFEIYGSFVSSAEAHGRFVAYYEGRVKNSGNFIATLVTDDNRDAGVNGLAPTASEVGPEALPDAKDAFTSDLPCINPIPGHYTAILDPALSNVGDSISRLGSYGFTVSVDKDGLFWIDTTYDYWAYYGFLVTCGSFNAQNGQGWDGYGGTNCPTDGFGFVGSFVSPTEARGIYKDLSWRCQVVGTGYFIATLDPVPDSGATFDTVTTTETGIVVDSGEIDR